MEGNKENIYIAETSPCGVWEAYLKQFESDFRDFLKCRGEEMVPRGRMLITILGSIRGDHPLSAWEFVGIKLNDMVKEVSIRTC